jgi:glycosyltransferase involved in cell wall biosynthesis
MKIGFLGNANNYPFILARALKRLGQEVVFILLFDQACRLDRPENRYTDLGPPYPDWIIDVSPMDVWKYEVELPQLDEVLQVLRGCDAVVLNQYALCLAPEIKRPTMALLTGTDILTLGKYDFVDHMVNHFIRGHRVREVELFYLRRVFAQRLGIRSAFLVIFFPPGAIPEGDAILAGLGVKESRRLSLKMVDVEEILPVPPPFNNPVRIFCATRLTWDKSRPPFHTELDYKGSDIMVRGLGMFVRMKPDTALDIHLVKKGAHVSETMALVEEEGLSPYVTWHEEMSQMEVWEQFKRADIIFEQLDTSDIGMAGLDAMALGRPVIGHERYRRIQEGTDQPSPICEATTPEEVAAQLHRLVLDPEERQRVGKASRRYVETCFSADLAARTVMDRLTSFLGGGKEFSLNEEYSVLQATYRQLELDYFYFTELQRRLWEVENRLQKFEGLINRLPAFLKTLGVKFLRIEWP